MSLTRNEVIAALADSIAAAGAFNHFSALFAAKVIAADQSLVREMPRRLPASWAIASEAALLYLRKRRLELSARSARAEIRGAPGAPRSPAALRYPAGAPLIRELMRTFARAPPSRLSVRVTVVGATAIPCLDQLNTVDPFCELQLEGEPSPLRTSTRHETQSPEWNETFEFAHERLHPRVLTIGLFDEDELGDPMKISQLAIPLPHEVGEVEGRFPMAPVAAASSQIILVQPSLRLRFVTSAN
jgi:hypothetical protein